jgi:hypothetical protein
MERSRLILGLKDFNLVSYAEHVGGGKLADAYKRHNVTGIQSIILDFPTIFVTLQRVRKRLHMFTGGHVSKKNSFVFGCRCSRLQEITNIAAESQLDRYLSTRPCPAANKRGFYDRSYFTTYLSEFYKRQVLHFTQYRWTSSWHVGLSPNSAVC